MSDLNLIHFTFEAILAGLVWLLYRRAASWCAQAAALEAEQGVIQKKFEAATAALHLRLQHAERQLSTFHPSLNPPLPSSRRPQYLPAAPKSGAPLPRSRGELELRMKIERLSQEWSAAPQAM